MKQYLLFLGENYYPHGGWKDFHGRFYSVEEARRFVADYPTFDDNGRRAKISWAHVVDTTIFAANTIVWTWNASEHARDKVCREDEEA